MNSRQNQLVRYLTVVIAIGLAFGTVYAQSRRSHSPMPTPFATPSAKKFPKVLGWPAGVVPHVPEGFSVDALASGLESPRWLYVLPNNDVLVSQARTVRPARLDAETVQALREGGSVGPSPNQITLLRDADGDGLFETREVFLDGLNQPFGMALHNGYLYVANTDSVVRFPYREGVTRIDARREKIVDLPAGGDNNHWTRNISFSPRGDKLYITVGSQTNADEEGLDAREPRRAAILECNPDGSGLRIYASGLRNPNGMDWMPDTGELWTVVNERDDLGDNLPPDFLTSVRQGGFYGWPFSYFGNHEDPRHKGERRDLVSKAIVPDLALGAHTASLGLLFSRTTSFPDSYRHGAFIAQHGSWNGSNFSGYRITFAPFNNGRPSGLMEDFVTGFIASEDSNEVYGRPVGLALLHDGSLLIADDAGGHIWRVRYAAETAGN